MTGTSSVDSVAARAGGQARPAASDSGARSSLIASGIGGIGASLCCVVPFVLVLLGVGGAWIGSLTALAPYRPIFIGVTLVFLALAFRKLYLVPRACDPGTRCAEPAVLRRQRIVFWSVSVVLAALIGFPWYAPLMLA
jgi:mercuric ion transport protein